MLYQLHRCNLLIESKRNLIIATHGYMFVKRNIWKCDGIQLSLLFVVYSDEKHFVRPGVGCSHCFMSLMLTQTAKL